MGRQPGTNFTESAGQIVSRRLGAEAGHKSRRQRGWILLRSCGRGRRDGAQQVRHPVEQRGESIGRGRWGLDAETATPAAFHSDRLEQACNRSVAAHSK